MAAKKKKKKLSETGPLDVGLAKPEPREPAGDDELEIDLDQTAGVEKQDSEDKDFEDQLKHDKLKTEITTNLGLAIKAKSNWMIEAKEDIKFCLGDQWEEQDRLDLKRQNRPVMVFNKIKPLVKLVTGHLIQTKARIQAFPEGGEDQKFTSVMDKAMEHIEKVSHLNFKMSYLFSGGERAGENWIEFHIDYDDDPIFGQLKIPNLGPFKIFMDPSGVEYDLSDCGFGFKVMKLSKSRIKKIFPEKERQIDQYVDDSLATMITNSQNVPSGDESDYGNSPVVPRGGITTDTMAAEELAGDMKECTVIEYWKKQYVDRWFVYFVEDGAIEEFNTTEEAQAEISRRQKNEHDKLMKEHAQNVQKIVGIKKVISQVSKKVSTPPPVDDVVLPDAPDIKSVKIEHAIRRRKVEKMTVAIQAGNLLLTDGLVDSPFEPHWSKFPFFRFIAEWAPEAEKPELRVQGLVRSLKDPQREKNKSRSQFLHILNTSANSGWIGDEDALTSAQWEEIKELGAVPGITIKKKKGSTLERIHPVEPSTANVVREKASDDDFKEVSGINADLLAMDESGNPSGKAIALKIRQAITILQPDLENFRYTKILIGQFLFSIIPTMFDAAKLEKILGTKFMQENQLSRQQINAYLTMIKDGKYHVQISEAGAPDTMREETFEDLMELAQRGVSMPPDLYIDFMNLPNKQEVLNRVKEWTSQQQQMEMATKGKRP